MRKALVGVAILLLAACTTTPAPKRPSAVTTEEWKDALQAYARCMLAAADHYAASDANAHEIADAAHGSCVLHYQLLESVTNSLFLAAAGPQDPILARRMAAQRTAKSKRWARDKVIERVVALRPPAAAPLATPFSRQYDL